ncbi:MAG: YifB family Mg chelatase-like AAA ATPase [Legionellales bacterium]|jgi:magnesium chelatase family protein
MSLAVIYSRARLGLHAPLVTIEVHISAGIPQFAIAGLPETAVKESKHRVRSALLHSRFEFPAGRITVNLAPADLPKEGGRFDLPIALGILAATQQISKKDLELYEIAGELALSGEIRRIQGALPFALQTKQAQRMLIIPEHNALEANLSRCPIYPAQHLLDVSAHFNKSKPLTLYQNDAPHLIAQPMPDFSEVIGQYQAKRVLEIAASGGHNALMIGTPGAGKTMLAERLPSILPNMSEAEAIETIAIYSISDQPINLSHWGKRPFRNPHHTASGIALVGGGSMPKPGEISLAHNGVLFLDEFPEFNRKTIETLREPLESGKIVIARATKTIQFPARFQLICAMNPCPCGYLGASNHACTCTSEQVQRYQSKISGPMLDRIDLQLRVSSLPAQAFLKANDVTSESSAIIKSRVIAARNRALARAEVANAQLSSAQIKNFCQLDTRAEQLLEKALTQFNLSTRAYHKTLKIARTIADLDAAENINIEHVQEALGYRGFK